MSALQEIHEALQHDEAYKWSVENEHTNNMRMVLRAYKYPFTIDDCFAQIVYAHEQNRRATLTPDARNNGWDTDLYPVIDQIGCMVND